MSSRPALQFLVAAGLAAIAGGLWLSVRGDDEATDTDVEVLDGGPSPGTYAPTTTVGDRPLPGALEVLDLSGDTRPLGDLVGLPLVLNVWATSCAPCRREMPALQQVSEELDGLVRVVGLDPEDDVDTLQAYIDDLGVTYQQVRDPGGVIDALGIVALPTTLMVRADGTIADVHQGAFTAETLRAAIADDLGVTAP